MKKKYWDIFCQVIDNYGDIGVCWRLATQLAAQYPINVRLWLDDINALRQIRPEVANVDRQIIDRVEICIWQSPFMATSVADVVIEAFACELPSIYREAMKQQGLAATPPIWINLEYLSAEDWVEGCHAMPSLDQVTGVTKFFFFPGFTDKTGGLLRDQTLLAERDSFQASPTAKLNFLRQLGVKTMPSGLLISLFAYENNAMASLIAAWKNSTIAVTCIIPAGKILTSVNQCLATTLVAGDCYSSGQLTLRVIPFLSQSDYDRLLWLCDVNFVRGEDSFIRAQWAAKPMVWHIYPQQENAHLVKLAAFLQHYAPADATATMSTVRRLWQQWNQQASLATIWPQCMIDYSGWAHFSNQWCQKLALMDDLVSNLVRFVENKDTEIC